MATPNIPAELNSLDFGVLIGGPLSAIVQAQAASAKSTVDFVNSVGFDETGAPRTSVFTFTKPVTDPDDQTVLSETVKLSVPYLSMVPIPYIRIDEATIDFNAKITSLQSKDTASSMAVGANGTAKFGWGPFQASLSASFSGQKQSSSQDKTTRTYTMGVHVRAVQAEVPGGLDRILNILEESITTVPTT